ncbi:MAG: ABC transporter substrate-binding protein, partial [Deltaproteobacteria bacterium]|nr:ABC transporter substrate-binding protein [Deltaproteobacteria bacterium]
LAESIEVMTNPKDIKVKIYNDATFHTGDPVTAHDVKWTYEQCLDPQNANMMAGPLDEIESIEVLDDYTFIFHFWEPYAAWRELMWIGICSKKYYDRVGREQFRKHPVGSGLLRFVERKIGESITLEVDPNYTRYERLKKVFGIDPPNFRYLQFVVVPDEVSRVAMLETGELDIVGGILPHQMKRLRRNRHVKIKRCGTVPSLIGLAANPYADPIMRDSDLG